jgi:hypothetical protein
LVGNGNDLTVTSGGIDAHLCPPLLKSIDYLSDFRSIGFYGEFDLRIGVHLCRSNSFSIGFTKSLFTIASALDFLWGIKSNQIKIKSNQIFLHP